MQVIDGKIEVEARSAVNTLSPLTDSNIRGIEMAQISLPKEQFTFKQRRAAARFWSYVGITTDPDECWEWTRSCAWGYGAFWFEGRMWRTHRFAYLLVHGLLQHDVLHSCDNPPCCNPRHLRDGTDRDNMIDASKRGRLQHSKLTTSDIPIIRARSAAGELPASIARDFNVSRQTIQQIRKKHIWAHIPDVLGESKNG